MFAWTTRGRKVFKSLSPDLFEPTKTLAANQGLYNGFLAAGLLWGLVADENATALRVFFLSCVIVAGVYGGMTVSKKIVWIQALPAGLALAATIA